MLNMRVNIAVTSKLLVTVCNWLIIIKIWKLFLRCLIIQPSELKPWSVNIRLDGADVSTVDWSSDVVRSTGLVCRLSAGLVCSTSSSAVKIFLRHWSTSSTSVCPTTGSSAGRCRWFVHHLSTRQSSVVRSVGLMLMHSGLVYYRRNSAKLTPPPPPQLPMG